MSVKNKAKDSFKRIGIKFKHPSLMSAKGLEGLVDFTTPVASVLTLGTNPNYNIPEKIIYGPYQTAKVIYDSVLGYATNEGIRDFINGKMGELFHIIGNTTQNITEKPVESLVAVAGAYALGKTTKYLIKTIRESKEDKYLNQPKE